MKNEKFPAWESLTDREQLEFCTGLFGGTVFGYIGAVVTIAGTYGAIKVGPKAVKWLKKRFRKNDDNSKSEG